MRLFKLGTVSKVKFDRDFDYHYDFFKNKAIEEGFFGEIKIIRDKNSVSFYKIIEDDIQ